eukprot:16404515-Heterocapsa_arctica.AAC.1
MQGRPVAVAGAVTGGPPPDIPAVVEFFRSRPPRITIKLADFEDMARASVIVQLHLLETERELRRRLGKLWLLDLTLYNTFHMKVLLAVALELENQGIEDNYVIWIARVQ